MNSSRAKKVEPRATDLTFSKQAMTIHLADGRVLTVPLAWYPRLLHASPSERHNYEIVGDGEYLHWPELDEDLTVVGLLEGCRSAETAASVKKWLSTRKSTNNNERTEKRVRRAG